MPAIASANRVSALRRAALFAELSEEALSYLAEKAEMRSYAPGRWIFSEGDACEGLAVIESGTVRVFTTSPDGREQVLATEYAGSTMGELAVFDGGPHPSSARAINQVALLLIRKEDFRSLCREHPDVALRVLRLMGRRLRSLLRIVEELSFATVRQRLIRFLLRLAKQQGKATVGGIEFTIPFSNQELAAHIGTVKELISRNLNRLNTQGLIRLRGKLVLIPDVKELTREAKQKS